MCSCWHLSHRPRDNKDKAKMAKSCRKWSKGPMVKSAGLRWFFSNLHKTTQNCMTGGQAISGSLYASFRVFGHVFFWSGPRFMFQSFTWMQIIFYNIPSVHFGTPLRCAFLASSRMVSNYYCITPRAFSLSAPLFQLFGNPFSKSCFFKALVMKNDVSIIFHEPCFFFQHRSCIYLDDDHFVTHTHLVADKRFFPFENSFPNSKMSSQKSFLSLKLPNPEISFSTLRIIQITPAQ